jgi:hypothetical protein
MEEIEFPTEHLQEAIKEKAEELQGKKEGKFTLYIAVCTALMAVFAALAGLMAGDHSNEALIDQIKASDQWAFYQAKSIKSEIRVLQAAPLNGSNKSPEEIKKEEGEIRKTAEDYERSSEGHLKKHLWLARSVTFFQIAIAVSAMSILTKKTFLWFAGILISLIGLSLFVIGLF